MDKKEIYIVALSNSESSPGNFAVVLEEVSSKQRMAIIIGAFEAQAIAIHLERMQLPRPLTHDLIKSTIITLGAKLKEVIIHAIQDGMYQAWLVLETITGEEKQIDARASDALALAIRHDCPIFINSAVLENAILEKPDKKYNLIKGSIIDYSLEELQTLLNDLLAKEDYESATRIRDMIRKKSTD